MANILHLDENDVACRAFRGILSRAGHRCVTVSSVPDAVKALRELVKFDLVFIEVKLKGENGINFLAQIREDCFLQHVPVVVYSMVSDQIVVKKALSLRIQNYLIKPYSDSHVYAEITKALNNPWRNLLFEEEKSFCAQMGFGAHTLQEMRERLMKEIELFSGLLPLSNVDARRKEIEEHLDTLQGDAEASGYWGLVELLGKLKAKVEIQRWEDVPVFVHDLDYARLLIFTQLHPEHLPEGFLSEQEKKEKEEAREKARWLETNVTISGPLVSKTTVFTQIDTLQCCPVIDSVAASFSMYADGQASNLSHVVDQVSKDPGLSYQVLVSVNKLEREDMNVVDDPRTAIGLLGELRLSSLAKIIPTVEERYMLVAPYSWPHYWIYLMGVARMAQYACRNLEFKDLEPLAYTAGLIHDIGKLLLLKLYPFAFQAIVNYSKKNNLPLHFAEESYIQTSTREMGFHFASQGGLPPAYMNVIRWVETPELATADAELVAIVSLARSLCMHNHIGYCGDTPKDSSPSIESTQAWQILKQRVFPSFNLQQFEAQAHAYGKELKQELLGRIK